MSPRGALRRAARRLFGREKGDEGLKRELKTVREQRRIRRMRLHETRAKTDARLATAVREAGMVDEALELKQSAAKERGRAERARAGARQEGEVFFGLFGQEI